MNPSINECYEVGKDIGELHNLSQNFNDKKENSLSINELKKFLINVKIIIKMNLKIYLMN